MSHRAARSVPAVGGALPASTDVSRRRPDWPQVALLAAALAVLILALLPLVVVFDPSIYFLADPRSALGKAPTLSVGPAAAAWLQVLGVLVAAGAATASVWAGGRVRWLASLLVLLGIGFAGYHLTQHMTNRVTLGAWIGAASLGLAAVHLGQHERPRRWLIAGCVSLLVTLALHTLWYVFVQHAMTVAAFHRASAAAWQGAGWSNAVAAEHYRRRLAADDAIGTLGLSNVYGSLVAALTMLAAGCWISILIAPRESGGFEEERPANERRRFPLGKRVLLGLLPGVLTTLGVMIVVLTHSKGAAVALVVGLGVLAALLLMQRWGGRPRWLVPAGGIALVVLAVAVVLGRGAMGPPATIHGERSLLFRFYYWQAAVNLVAAHWPVNMLTGTGPAGFAAGYLWAKNPLQPETVVSTHNVFVDFITMLGIGGWAWTLVLLTWLWQAGCAAAVPRKREGSESVAVSDASWRVRLGIALVPTVALFGTVYIVQWAARSPSWGLIWLASLASFAALLTWLTGPNRISPRWGVVGLFAAAVVLLMHNQIEMSFSLASACGPAWVIVALAAGGRARGGDKETRRGGDKETGRQGDKETGRDASRGVPHSTPEVAVYARSHESGKSSCLPVSLSPPRVVTTFILVATLLGLAVFLAAANAMPIARQQRHLAAAQTAVQAGRMGSAIRQLDAAAAIVPSDPLVLRWQVALRVMGGQYLAEHGRMPVAKRLIDEAVALLDEAPRHGLHQPAMQRMLGQVQHTAAELFHEPHRDVLAVRAFEAVLAKDPYSVMDYLHLADFQWQLGRHETARKLYRQTLKLNRQSYLDPPLTPEQRQQIESRLK